MGLDASRLTAKQLSLLTLPFNLSLLAKIANAGSVSALNFSTVHDLFALFWEEKRHVVNERFGSPDRWNLAIDALCNHMSSQQSLSIAMTLLDDHYEIIQLLISENVLILDDRHCSFFHESLFDYTFARRFAAQRKNVANWLRDDKQDLFRRAQVRQILQYLREEDRQQYLLELAEVLQNTQIRFHLKWMVFAWLGQMVDPDRVEWNQLVSSVASEPSLLDLLFDLLRRNAVFFRIAAAENTLRTWLTSTDEKLIAGAFYVLGSNVKSHAADVCELLNPRVFSSTDWTNRAKFVLRVADLGAERCLFDLFLEIIDHGGFERTDPNSRRDEFWSYLYLVGKNNPAWASEAVGKMLDRSLSVTITAGESHPFADRKGGMPQYSGGDRTLEQIYRGAPVRFVREVLPIVVTIVKLNRLPKTGNHLVRDDIWRHRHFDRGYTVEATLLMGVEFGLRSMAQSGPDQFRNLADRLLADDNETCHFLVARGYAANGNFFANDAADFLLAHQDHLSLGYAGDRFASSDLLKVISPFCDESRLLAIQRQLLNFYPDFEKAAYGQKSFGSAQFTLMGAIDPQRRTPTVRKRLSELERKFGPTKVEEPHRIQGGLVPSPIPSKALEKMSDEQWLRAVAKYNRERTTVGSLMGGPLQLSQNLYTQAKASPPRFARLLRRFPSDTHPYYISNLLRALSDADAEVGEILGACRFAHHRDGKPFGQWICYCIGRLADQSIPSADLSMVAWYATMDPDPDLAREGGIFQRTAEQIDGLATVGLNSVRGAAANAIASLIHSDLDRLEFFRPAIITLVNDPSLAVRSQVSELLVAALRADRDFAVRQFLDLCIADDLLLGTRSIEQFLYYALATHFEALKIILCRMLESDHKFARVAGSRQVTLASLSLQEAHPLLQICLSGTEELRSGAAEILAANLGSAAYRDFCVETLLPFFGDESEEVRTKASTCFDSFANDLAPAEPLIAAFLESRAFLDNYAKLLDALDQSSITLESQTLAACEKFTDVFGSDATSIANRAAISTEAVSRLVIRVYGQSIDKGVRDRCLDRIDIMLKIGMLNIAEAVQTAER